MVQSHFAGKFLKETQARNLTWTRLGVIFLQKPICELGMEALEGEKGHQTTDIRGHFVFEK